MVHHLTIRARNETTVAFVQRYMPSGGRLKLAAASRIFVGAAYGSGLHVEDVVTCALSLSGGVYDELPLIT
jgi:hypothetical protein